MQDTTPINPHTKHPLTNCQIKKLQPTFDTLVPPCISGVSIRTIERVIKEGEQSIANTGTPKFSTPRKKRPRKAPITDIPVIML
jgi:hypothetical protein